MEFQMLTSLSITNFRGFSRFRLGGLGRVNLIVGKNNSGKSTILEAIEFLQASANHRVISRALDRRGEVIYHDDDNRSYPGIGINHLFYGHQISAESGFVIEGVSSSSVKKLTTSITEYKNDSSQKRFEFLAYATEKEEGLIPLAFNLSWDDEDAQLLQYPVSPDGEISVNALQRIYRQSDSSRAAVRFITASALDSVEALDLFDQVVLTPDEELVVDSLRIIAPEVEKIAAVGSSVRRTRRASSGGIVLKVSGLGGRIPIGSMGDGMWRMLGLALSLVRSGDGVLLIDEIDTGLHYSVMKSMWKLVIQTAEKLGVQVFATTHSRDCYESLASAIDELELGESEVSIQRIEKDLNSSVSFSRNEILAAAARGIEIR